MMRNLSGQARSCCKTNACKLIDGIKFEVNGLWENSSTSSFFSTSNFLTDQKTALGDSLRVSSRAQSPISGALNPSDDLSQSSGVLAKMN